MMIQHLLLHGVFSLAVRTVQGTILFHVVPWAPYLPVTGNACHGRDTLSGKGSG